VKSTLPSNSELAEALGVSVRRVGQLKSEKMPCDSIPAALAWRQNKQAGDNTAEALRGERIRLLKAQAERHETENLVRRKQLLEIGDVRADCLIVCGKARDRFLKMSNNLPPKLSGLATEKIAEIIHLEVVQTLENLCRDFAKLYGSQDGQ
jgi:phage terminase Nu1 subunit (DNA packaging protein)